MTRQLKYGSGFRLIASLILTAWLFASAAYGDTTADALAKYQAEHAKAQQQAQKLQQDMANTQAVILRLEGAIAALTEVVAALGAGTVSGAQDLPTPTPTPVP